MKHKLLNTVPLLTMAALAGCATPPPTVKDVLADRDAYLTKNFSPANVSPAVLAQVRSADSTDVGFHHMKITTVVAAELADKSKPSPVRTNTLFITAAGGPLLMIREEDDSNGLPFYADFSISYRGFLQLRSERVPLSGTLANYFVHVTDIGNLPTPRELAGSGAANFRWTLAVDRGVPKPINGSYNCTHDGEMPASTINAKLTGTAYKLNCSSVNDANVAVEEQKMIYLDAYGFGLLIHRQSSTATYDFTVRDVTID